MGEFETQEVRNNPVVMALHWSYQYKLNIIIIIFFLRVYIPGMPAEQA